MLHTSRVVLETSVLLVETVLLRMTTLVTEETSEVAAKAVVDMGAMGSLLWIW